MEDRERGTPESRIERVEIQPQNPLCSTCRRSARHATSLRAVWIQPRLSLRKSGEDTLCGWGGRGALPGHRQPPRGAHGPHRGGSSLGGHALVRWAVCGRSRGTTGRCRSRRAATRAGEHMPSARSQFQPRPAIVDIRLVPTTIQGHLEAVFGRVDGSSGPDGRGTTIERVAVGGHAAHRAVARGHCRRNAAHVGASGADRCRRSGRDHDGGKRRKYAGCGGRTLTS
ncbi:hypothetical protein HNR15_001887 [Allobranchiibius huperziae]|uniref:Uncharacterized protein n=1 Tax=Allobranchiibius huperziae TaxID=1874116 RepID=A0A853DIR8_9MICO|nr:hypothetical protein [Allobranchiibius huperziae]